MKAKRLLLLIGSVCLAQLVALLFVVACAAPAPAPAPTPTPKVEPIVLRLTDPSPAKGIRVDGVNWMIETVNNETGGRFKFELYYGGVLLKVNEMLEGIGEGAADMGFVSVGSLPKKVPVWLATSTIMIGPKQVPQTAEMFHRLLDEVPPFRADLEKWNLKGLGFHAMSGMSLYMNKPLDTIYDLEGKKVRASAQAHLTHLEAMGATPVYMPMAEAFTAMERGTIDGVYTSLEAGHRFKFQEISEYIYPCLEVSAGYPNILVINIDTWNKMPEDCRLALSEACRGMSFYIADLIEASYDEFRADFAEAGCTVKDIPETDLRKWSEMPKVANLPAEWIEDATEQGLPGAMILRRVKEVMAEVSK